MNNAPLDDSSADHLIAELRRGNATDRAFADWIADRWQRCDLAEMRVVELRRDLALATTQLLGFVLASTSMQQERPQ